MHSTNNINDGYYGSGKRLWYSINKYGKENHIFEILKYFESRKLLKEAEKELVNENTLKDPMCMNLKLGGEGGLNGLCEESIKKIREGSTNFLNKLWLDPNFIENHKKRASNRFKKMHIDGVLKYNTFTNKKHTDESKNKMSISHRGRGIKENNSQFGTCWVFKNELDKKINKIDLNVYLNNGWKLGRFVKNQIKPSYEQLIKDISELGYRGAGYKYKVSDNTIRSWKFRYEK
jgi:hypothetical protein